MIMEIAAEPEVGVVYTGTVVKVMDFGAFVNFFGKRDGLVHVSQMANERVNHPSEKIKSLVLGGHGDSMVAMVNHTEGPAEHKPKLLDSNIIQTQCTKGDIPVRIRRLVRWNIYLLTIFAPLLFSDFQRAF